MSLDLRLERALDRIELVTGVGTRDSGRLCVMSLVACLGGEEHTDSPACASPLLRAFAIPLNDNMPQEARQRLKPFAPRIIGTNDGMDAARAELLRRALADEILPRLADQRPPRAARFAAPLWRIWARLGLRRLQREARWMMEQVGSAEARDPARAAAAAGAVGRLLARSARDAATPEEARRHWDLAIGLLDRLCDIGPARAPAPVVWASRLEQVLQRRDTMPGEPAAFGKA